MDDDVARNEGADKEAPGMLEAAYAARYADLYARHWWWRAREEIVVDEVGRIAEAWDGDRAILDVGCGDGLIFPRLAQFGDVEGVEPDSRLVTGRSDHVIHTVPFEDFSPARRYSLILMLDVLEHLENPIAALHRCRELLEPDGRLVLTVPAFKALWTTHDDLNHHFTRYRKRTLRTVIDTAGLNLDDTRYLFHWVFIAKVGVRLIETFRRKSASLPAVPRGPANRALYRLCRLEDRLLGPLRLPFGSSLLAKCSVGSTPPPRSG
ncbi:MAG: class I SAM-dependent methyltransferase [Gemmatimonadota bacterium]|nr:class I SAM-dependent methyltransferase [Gemmatimonadota bacterium]